MDTTLEYRLFCWNSTISLETLLLARARAGMVLPFHNHDFPWCLSDTVRVLDEGRSGTYGQFFKVRLSQFPYPHKEI